MFRRGIGLVHEFAIMTWIMHALRNFFAGWYFWLVLIFMIEFVLQRIHEEVIYEMILQTPTRLDRPESQLEVVESSPQL